MKDAERSYYIVAKAEKDWVCDFYSNEDRPVDEFSNNIIAFHVEQVLEKYYKYILIDYDKNNSNKEFANCKDIRKLAEAVKDKFYVELISEDGLRFIERFYMDVENPGINFISVSYDQVDAAIELLAEATDKINNYEESRLEKESVKIIAGTDDQTLTNDKVEENPNDEIIV